MAEMTMLSMSVMAANKKVPSAPQLVMTDITVRCLRA